MNLFNWIDELFVGKRDWNSFSESDQKKFSPFMVNRYLSMGSDYLQIVNYMQKYWMVTPHKSLYQFYCNLLPKKKTFLRYMNGKQQKTNQLVIPFITEYFDVSKHEASEYYNLMSKEELILLIKKFGKSDKEIKKMKIK